MAKNASLVGIGKTTLVLSHGYGGSRAVWDAVVPQLSQRYQLLLFDWAFDPSPASFSFESFADELVSLLDNTRLKGVVFVGHSMSGMIGCIASVKRPELFSRLVLVAASPRYMNSEDYEGGFDPPMIESMLGSIESDFDSWSESFAREVMATDDPAPSRTFQASLKAMNPEAALSLGKMIFHSDLRHLLRSVEVPCSIIQGTRDMVVPPAVARYMKSRIRGETSLEMMENQGHFPQLTSPAKFVEIIDREAMKTMF